MTFLAEQIDIPLRFKRLSELAVLPSKANPTDAGFDLTATSINFADGYLEYGTGLAVEIPEGYVGLVFPRSSISKTTLTLANSVGVVDAPYRGEIRFRFRPAYGAPESAPAYQVGDRIGQLVVMKLPGFHPQWADELSDTARGTGGFGSSGA